MSWRLRRLRSATVGSQQPRPLPANMNHQIRPTGRDTSQGFQDGFAQNLSDISEMSIKHNCEIAAFPLSDVMREQKKLFSPFVLSHSKKVDIVNFGRFSSICFCRGFFSPIRSLCLGIFHHIQLKICHLASLSATASFLLGAPDIQLHFSAFSNFAMIFFSFFFLTIKKIYLCLSTHMAPCHGAPWCISRDL